MAARTGTPNARQQEQTRAAIQTTQLVKRLQCFALDEVDDAKNKVELDSNRLKAIEVLLRKALPDLSSVALTDPNGEAFTINVVQRGHRPPE